MRYPRWKIITLGHRFTKRCLQDDKRSWQDDSLPEGAAQDPAADDLASTTHPPNCASTLIETESRTILVDPGDSSPRAFQTALFERGGFEADEIDTVFLTHFHKNHWQSLALFPKAAWMMSRVELHRWQTREKTSEEERNMLARIVPIEEHHLPGIETLRTPGHTQGSTSLVFEAREGMVVIAGDAVLSFEHFDNREPSENAEDFHEARRSIDRIAKMADIVVPGHDNFFVV